MTKMWKTFPCKNCLIKKLCEKICFKVSGTTTMDGRAHRRHVFKNRLCIGCGEYMSPAFSMYCDKCNNLGVRILLEDREQHYD